MISEERILYLLLSIRLRVKGERCMRHIHSTRVGLFATVFAALICGSAAESVAADAQLSPKQVIDRFNQLAFFDNKPVEAVERYFSPNIIEHDPGLPSGRAAIVEYLKKRWASAAPMKDKIYHVIADGELVAVHHHVLTHPEDPNDPGLAYVDLFRVHNGLVVEHWDVGQAIPRTAANSNGMF
jgi:predicted SnoaL-like aldol condensation-catalyzing enzyme